MRVQKSRFCYAVFFICVSLFGVLKVGAQHGNLVHYTNEDGLPTNGIRGLELDEKTGMLWVGTEGGVVQFNGQYFLSPLSEVPASYKPRVYGLGRTIGHQIFVQNENEPVKLIDEYGFLLPTGLNRAFVFKQVEVDSQYTKSLRTCLDSNSMLLTETTRFIYIKERKVCLAIYRDSLMLFDGAWKHLPIPVQPAALLRLDGHLVLLDKDKNFFSINPGRWTVKKMAVSRGKSPAQLEHAATLFWETGMEKPLVLAREGLSQLSGSGDTVRIEPLSRYPPMPFDQISHVRFIRVWEGKGLVFYGTGDNGLFVGKTGVLQTLSPVFDNGNKYPPVYAFLQLNDDFLQDASGRYYTTSGAGATRFPRGVDQFTNLFRSADGSIWYERSDTIFHVRAGKPDEKIYLHDGLEEKLFAETKGNTYVASATGIGIIQEGKYQRLFDFPHWSFARMYMNINDFKEWSPGVLAIATHRLYLFDVERRRLAEVSLPGLPVEDCMIRSLYRSGEYMFITTYGMGIFCEKGGVVKPVPMDKMGYLSHAHCMLEDKYGFVWVSTNHGLFKVGLQALKESYDKNLSDIYFHFFGKSDGLINSELNGGCQPCGVNLSGGNIAFPTMNGIVLIHPAFNSPVPDYPVQITDMTIDGKKISFNALEEPIAWPSSISNLSFFLRIPMWANRENIYVSYMLRGYDETWKKLDVESRYEINFGNITAGNYELVIRIRGGFEVYDFLYTRFSFSLPLPWYQRWWAIVIGFLMIVLIFSLTVRQRTRYLAKKGEILATLVEAQTKDLDDKNIQLVSQLEQLNEQNQRLQGNDMIKTRLISIINHDLLAPIKFIGLIGKDLERFAKRGVDDGIAQSSTTLITVSSQMEQLANNILNWIHVHQHSYKEEPQVFNLMELINEVTRIPANMAREKKIEFQLAIPPLLQISQYKEALGVIIYNLAVNAVKYIDTGSILITAESLAGEVNITVSDTGIGMSPDMTEMLNQPEKKFTFVSEDNGRKYRFGHFIIRELLTLIKGKIHVGANQRKGRGTDVRVTFPAFTEYYQKEGTG